MYLYLLFRLFFFQFRLLRSTDQSSLCYTVDPWGFTAIIKYTIRNWCLQTVVLEKTLESSLGSKIKWINLKGKKPWIVIGRIDVEAEAPVSWSSDANSWLIGKVPDAGKDWGQKEKKVTEHEKAGRHHWCNGYELGQTSRDGEGQGGLACCSPWGSQRVGHDWATEQQQWLTIVIMLS